MRTFPRWEWSQSQYRTQQVKWIEEATQELEQILLYHFVSDDEMIYCFWLGGNQKIVRFLRLSLRSFNQHLCNLVVFFILPLPVHNGFCSKVGQIWDLFDRKVFALLGLIEKLVRRAIQTPPAYYVSPVPFRNCYSSLKKRRNCQFFGRINIRQKRYLG